MQASSGSPVTSLTFRTDHGAAAGATADGTAGGVPTLASGHADGRVLVWGLAQRNLLGEVTD